jgi:hypothetical protein
MPGEMLSSPGVAFRLLVCKRQNKKPLPAGTAAEADARIFQNIRIPLAMQGISGSETLFVFVSPSVCFGCRDIPRAPATDQLAC